MCCGDEVEGDDYSGSAGEGEEFQAGGEGVDGADDAVEHAGVDFGLHGPVIFLLVCCGVCEEVVPGCSRSEDAHRSNRRA